MVATRSARRAAASQKSQKSQISRAKVVLAVLAAVAFQLLLTSLDLPLLKVGRNILSKSTPDPLPPKYACDDLSSKLTVVVTVKDACSQMPGFVKALEPVVGTDTSLILTYPNLTACDPLALKVDLAPWRDVKTVPLPPSSSPMRGWSDSVGLIKTEFALLLRRLAASDLWVAPRRGESASCAIDATITGTSLCERRGDGVKGASRAPHTTQPQNADNDGYALDPHFACELVGALEARDSTYVVAAPMLYESKADGSLAAHATQTKLRWQDGYVRHDHSIARALNRGRDFPEGDQTDFLEDHGFVVRTSAISDLVDPRAAYTLEYLDMILSLKAQKRRVVFVPTARLEFRIAEFSWRDVPYFMYKRSEATCHGTRDYLSKKWRARFPNTGFWTYIKYTIVESHTYSHLEKLPLKYQLQLFLAFFEMAGYNRYDSVPYVEVLEAVDGGTRTTLNVNASRKTERKAVLDPVRKNATAADLLPRVGKGWLPALEADLPLEYMPFATMVLASPLTCSHIFSEFPRDLCGVAVEKGSGEHCHDGDCHSHHEHGHDHDHRHGCECYVNLPTFKSRNWIGDVLAKLASLLKVPSRVTTYLELFLGSDHAAAAHVAPLIAGVEPVVRQWALEERDVFTDIRLYTCGGAATSTSEILEPCPAVPVAFGVGDRVVHFSGRPAAPGEVVEALAAL